jgi:Ca-activated chloride channel family protein
LVGASAASRAFPAHYSLEEEKALQLHLTDWWPANTALTFVRPWLLLLLLAIPLLAYLRGRRGTAAALTFSSTATFYAIGKQSVARAGKFLRALLLATLAIFIVAIAQPRLGKSLTQVEASGIDIMLVLDVSNSMLAKDFTLGGERATRLDAVREVTRKFIEARPNDRIGMIAFGTRPYVVSPMTLDHDWLLQNLERVRIGLIEGSTAIGSGMAAGGNRLNDDKNAKSRALVLMTDGDNNSGKIPPNAAAEALKSLHIKFYAIGIGTNGTAPFPVLDPRNGNVVTDALGNVLYQWAPVSFNETGLREIARIADGQFFRAADTHSLEQIYREIDKMEKSTVSVKKYQQYRELFPICIMGGVGLFLAQLILSQTIWKKLP